MTDRNRYFGRFLARRPVRKKKDFPVRSSFEIDKGLSAFRPPFQPPNRSVKPQYEKPFRQRKDVSEYRQVDADEKIRITRYDWILVIGVILAPMTNFRFGKVGPGEVLCLLWSLKYIKTLFDDTMFSRFFAVFISVMFVGQALATVFVPEEVAVYGGFTWIYLGTVASLMFNGLKTKSKEYLENLLQVCGAGFSLWFFFIYLYSFCVSSSFLGAPIWYGGVRYAGCAHNPHQFAVGICVAMFVCVRFIIHKKNIPLNIACVILAWIQLVATQSSTGFLATGCSILVLANVQLLRTRAFYGNKAQILAASYAIVIGLTLACSTWLYGSFMDWVKSDPNGEGRLELFSKIGNCYTRCPISILVGLGPGVHSADENGQGAAEFHNTYLEVLSSTGLMGTFAFALLTVRLIVLFKQEPYYYLPLTALYAFGFSGFAMRRLPYWTFLVIIAAILSPQQDVSKRRSTKESSEVFKSRLQRRFEAIKRGSTSFL